MKVRVDDSGNEERLARLLHWVQQDQLDRWSVGDYSDVQEYFAQLPELLSNQDAALILIYSQFCLAERAGLCPNHEEYLSRFPEFAEELAKQFEVHQELKVIGLDGLADDSQLSGHSRPQFISASELDLVVDKRDGSDASQLGRYVLLEKIGHGTFGTVYRALDSKLNRVVAVKIPRAGRFASEDEEERFLREATAVARLDHPGIVKIFDIGRDHGVAFIVAEYLQGAVLSKVIDSGRMGFRDAASLVMKVCTAIEHAHGQGIIHRDLKPSNIILTPDNEPRVLDFGLAKTELPSSMGSFGGVIVGAPAYMSPEQASGNGHHADARSDVYSLGVILYQLITSELPFRGTFQAIIDQVRTREPLDARQLDPEIPRDLNTICMKALAKEPSRRFVSAQEMADELNRFLERKPIQSRPVGRVEKTGLWIRRNPGVSLLTASVVAALFLGLTISSVFAVRLSMYASAAQRQNNQLQRAVYNHQISLTQHAIGAGQIAQARGLLEMSPAELRRWEWHYWRSTLHGDLRTISVNLGSVIAFQPTGSLIAIGDDTGIVQVVSGLSGTEVRTVRLHQAGITALSFSPDGSLLLSAAQDSSVRSWSTDALLSTNDLAPLQVYESVIGAVNSFVFRPDGKRFSMGTENGCWQFRDIQSSTMLFSLEWGSSSPATLFTPSTTEQLFASGAELVEMKIPGGAKRSLLKHDGAITSLSSSVDGGWVVSTSHDRTARVWNRETQSYRTLTGHTDEVLCSAFSPVSDLIATGGKDTLVRLWDSRTGDLVSVLKGHVNQITQLCFLSRGDLLASVSADGCVKLWDIQNLYRKPRRAAQHLEGIGKLAYSPDGRLIASAAGDGSLGLYDATTSTELQILLHAAGECGGLSFANNGKMLLGLFDGRLRKWSIPPVPHGSETAAPGTSSAASALASLAIHEPSSSDWTEQTEPPGSQAIDCFAIAPSERFYAYAAEGRVIIREHSDGNIVGQHEIEFGDLPTTICAMTFSRDSKSLALGCIDGTIGIYDLSTRRKLLLPREHADKINDLAFAPAGDLLVTASEDGTVRMWSVTGGPSLRTIAGPAASVNSVCFDSSGDRILIAADDRMLRLWDSHEVVEIMSLKGDPMSQARFSPDGSQIAYPSADGGIEQFDTTVASYDERVVRWEVSRILAECPLLPDALQLLDAQPHWSQPMRVMARKHIEAAASTVLDAPRRILSLLLIDTPDRLETATELASSLLRYKPNDQQAKTLYAACLSATGRHTQAISLLPPNADIVDAPSAMISVLVATSEDNSDSSVEQGLLELIQKADRNQSVDDINADFYRYFQSVLDRRLLSAKQSYHHAEFDKTLRNLTLVSHFRPLSNEQGAMLVTSLAVQRQWKEAACLHSQLDHEPNDWVYLTNEALLKLAADDTEGYQTACEKLLSLDYRNAEPTKALLTTIACLVGERGVEKPQTLLTFVESLRKRPNAHPGVQILYGLAQFRCDMLKEAQATLRPMLLLTELAASDLGSLVVGDHLTELKIVQLICVSTLLRIEQQLGQSAIAEKLALKTQQLVVELDGLPPVYDGRLGPWNPRVAAELARRILADCSISEKTSGTKIQNKF